ncbi:MAG TPA: RsmE family RNA methyltransferase [Candidatus Eisenbacteria bacterium]
MPAEAAPSFVWIPELEGATTGSGELELSLEESHYLGRVCRVRPGDIVSGTDGRGAYAELRIVAVAQRVRAVITGLSRVARARRGWVCSGPPEGRRADWLVEKLAELGVEAWQPLECARGEWRTSAPTVARWRRLAVAGLRQSRRPFLMEVRPPQPLEQALGTLPPGSRLWLADSGGRRGLAPPAGDACTVGLIGPAAGFDDREKARASSLGFEPICLSDGRLRSETAALAWALWWSMGSA